MLGNEGGGRWTRLEQAEITRPILARKIIFWSPNFDLYIMLYVCLSLGPAQPSHSDILQPQIIKQRELYLLWKNNKKQK